MLLELAIGDAYGAGFEYADGMVECCNDLSRYVHHPRHRAIIPGQYTDDTQMSIAIAELIVSGADWTPAVIAEHFVRCFHRDQRTGYSQRFYGLLTQVKTGAELLARIRPDSDKSGAAMRAAPIGIFPTIDEVKRRCTVQARITHDTRDGIDAARAAALASHYFIYGLGDKRDLQTFLTAQVPGPMWTYTMPEKVESKGWMSVRAAIDALMRCDSLSELLHECIAFRGDVDTVATIALGAASCSDQYAADLSLHLVFALENGKYGRDHLIALDEKLMAMRA
jgi:ADP-ribosyl-[dinitrogen reductase] hydrolase